MAEFQKVMKQALRMCGAQEDCEACPFGKKLDCVCVLGDAAMMMDADKMERIVMDWAEKHPEPRYPSWNDAWKQAFPNGGLVPCPMHFDARCKPDDCSSCSACKERPISADIAEKLGIKPIGGVSDENARGD